MYWVNYTDVSITGHQYWSGMTRQLITYKNAVKKFSSFFFVSKTWNLLLLHEANRYGKVALTYFMFIYCTYRIVERLRPTKLIYFIQVRFFIHKTQLFVIYTYFETSHIYVIIYEYWFSTNLHYTWYVSTFQVHDFENVLLQLNVSQTFVLTIVKKYIFSPDSVMLVF